MNKTEMAQAKRNLLEMLKDEDHIEQALMLNDVTNVLSDEEVGDALIELWLADSEYAHEDNDLFWQVLERTPNHPKWSEDIPPYIYLTCTEVDKMRLLGNLPQGAVAYLNLGVSGDIPKEFWEINPAALHIHNRSQSRIEIPPEIGQMSALSELRCGGYYGESDIGLPKTLVGSKLPYLPTLLPNLHTLEIRDTEMSEVPSWVTQCYLREVFLRGSRELTLSQEFGQIEGLRRLDVFCDKRVPTREQVPTRLGHLTRSPSAIGSWFREDYRIDESDTASDEEWDALIEDWNRWR